VFWLEPFLRPSFIIPGVTRRNKKKERKSAGGVIPDIEETASGVGFWEKKGRKNKTKSGRNARIKNTFQAWEKE